ncbi:nicotinate (nicotinamide) nucleotide adenylyltransferase [Paenibacillus camelliae]|uniref:nicotinate (nicotinamide) nucleotide adenylyltransferase n=1 Tax=Paenibacillus camelliae TaxID=512410 RepID=UPI0020406904|nr:nicotinate (nicotinamide) nucleotide adenylyltransferase [Paenibacillus camelliae]MCM3632815.1 nicotinate (nicotinamide) nucleotide adenylyltransferase [Paenibacillus camelliae]
MAKIGIYGSSFDPITNVHLWTASTVAHRCKLDRVIFLPCSSKRQDKKLNVSDEHRMNMVQLAIADNEKFEVDDYEMNQLGWEIATYITLRHFREKFPGDEIYFIMGADLLVDIGEGKWQRADDLIRENKFIVMARDGINMLSAISKSPILRNADDGQTFHLIDKGLAMEISSSYIRDELKMGGEPRYLMPDKVYEYIKTNNLYQ